MKKTLLFACLLLLGATCAQAATTVKIDNLNYTLNETDKTATVCYTSDATGDIVIPASVTYNETEYAVVEIAREAFYYISITSVVIPSSVKSISSKAFFHCSSLTSVTIEGEGLTSIGNDAFAYCSALTTINIPNSVTSFGDRFLDYCTNLTAPVYNATNFIRVPTSFEGDYTIPDGITTIFGSAFDGCNKLTSVTIPNSVTTIGREAFYNCSELTSITIPEGVTTIGAWAFCGCKFTSVTIPNSVTTIGGNAFYQCDKLTSVTLSSNLTSIGESAFYDCSSLTSVNIPASVTSIGNSAFGSCSALETITVESGNTVYDGRDNCNAIIETKTNTLVQGCTNSTIPASVQIIGAGALKGCSFTAITIPSTVTTIGSSAFSGASLTSITIPASVTSIGNSAFGSCSALETITVESGNTVYDSRNNCNAIIETETNTLVQGCKNTTIPDGVVAIGPNAFDALFSLTSITIPASVTTIGAYAFRDCQQLASIEIPNGVTTIGDWAFYNCALTNLTIPASVTTIGQSAFNNCWKLNSIVVKWQEPLKCGSDAFQSVSSATLCVPCGTSEKYKVADPWSNFSSNVTEQAYSIIAQTNDGSKGTVVVTQQPTCENNQAIIAVTTYYNVDINKSYDFLGWSDGVKDRERTITVTCDTVITGIFGFDQYEVTTKCEPAEGGTVTPGGTCEKYTKITLEATANAGYHFDHWTGGITSAKIEDKEVTSDLTYTAYFEPNTYTLSKGTITEGGTVSHAIEAKYGETVMINVYPNVGYKLGSLTVMDVDNNKKVEVSADYKFTMPAGNVTVSATFVEDVHDITIIQPVGGTVDASKTTAKENDEITLTITPDTGYELDEISAKDANGNDITISEDHKFTMPAAEVTITATFKATTATALQNTEMAEIYAENGRIYGADDMQIFTVVGQNVTEMNGQLSGVYVVKVGNVAQKVIVR